MKPRNSFVSRASSLIALGCLCITFTGHAAEITKANNTDDLNLTTSWTGGVGPTTTDVGLWNNTVTGSNTVNLGADLSWQGIKVTNPGGVVTLNGANTLTLGTAGIDLTTATNSLTVNPGVVLNGNQTWNANTNRAITLNGVLSGAGNINKTGSGFAILGGSVSNTYTGTTTVTAGVLGLTKTGGAYAVTGDFYGDNVASPDAYTTADNQFAPGSVLRITGTTGDHFRLELLGTTQTLGGLDNTTGTTRGVVQQREQVAFTSVSPNSRLILDVANAASYSYNGYLRDNGGIMAFTKTGLGTQTFSGTNITYTGGTTVNNGKLVLGGGGANGTIRGPLTVTGPGTVDYTGDNSFGYSGGSSVSSLTMVDATVGGANFGNHFWNNFPLNMTGSTLKLGATNNEFHNATITIGSSPNQSVIERAASNTTALMRIRDNTPMTFNVGNGAQAIDLLISAPLVNASGGSVATKIGPGTMALTGAQDNGSNLMAITGGTLILAKDLAANVRAVSGISNIGTGATVQLAGTGIDQIYGGAGSGNNSRVNMTGGTLDFNGHLEGWDRLEGTGSITNTAASTAAVMTLGETNGSSTFAGAITDGAGTMGLTKVGTGSLVLTGVQAYSGTTTLNAGTLSLTGSAIGPVTQTAGTLSIATSTTGAIALNGGTLNLTGSTAGALTAADGTTLTGESAASSITLGATTGMNLTVDPSTVGSLSTAGALTVNGTVNVALANNGYTYGAPFTVVAFGSEGGSWLDTNFAVASPSNYRGATFAKNANDVTLTIDGLDIEWDNVIGNGSVGDSVWDTASTINFWDAVNSANEIFAWADTVTFGNIPGADQTISVVGTQLPKAMTVNSSFNYTFNNGGSALLGGNMNLVKSGAGNLTLNVPCSYTGTTTINNGIVTVGAGITLATSAVAINGGSVSVENGGTLGTGPVTNNGSLSFTNSTAPASNPSGAISGTGSVAFNGPGVLTSGVGDITVNEANSYSGGTTITNTRVQASNSASFGTGAITVNAGGQIYAYPAGGVISNAVTINGTGWQEGAGFLGAMRLNSGVTFSGPITMGSNSRIGCYGGTGFITGAIGGGFNLEIHGNGSGDQLHLTGSSANTYTGTTTFACNSHLVLGKTGGAVAIPGDLYMSAPGTRGIVSVSQNNQFAPGSVLRYTVTPGDTRLELKGTTQTLGGIESTGFAGTYAAIQHSEFGPLAAVGPVSTLVLNVTGANSFSYGNAGGSAVLRSQGGTVALVKDGTGTQTLVGAGITYTGTTLVNGGTLSQVDTTGFVSPTTLATGTILNLNRSVATFASRNKIGGLISGTGTININNTTSGIAGGWVTFNSAANGLKDFTGILNVNSGVLAMDNVAGLWMNSTPTLNVASGGLFAVRAQDNVVVSSLNGAGDVGNFHNSTKMLTVGATNGSGSFSGIIHGNGTTNGTDGSLECGFVNLVKVGSGTQTLSGANISTGSTSVLGGTLRLDFAAGGTANILAAGSAVVLGGGTLEIMGGSGETNTQAHNGVSGTGTLQLTQNGATSINVTLGAVGGGSINFAGGDTTVSGGLAIPGTANFITTTTTAGNNGTTRLGGHMWNGSGNWASTATDGVSTTYVVPWLGTYTDIYNGTNPGPVALPTATPTAAVRILEATSGFANNTLGANETIDSLLMSAAGNAATVDMGSNILTLGNGAGVTGAVGITSAAQSLTFGTSANQGALTAGTTAAASTLVLNNQNGASTLTTNSLIRNNAAGGAVSLNTSGSVILNGSNTYTGSTTIVGGTLRIAGAGALGAGPYYTPGAYGGVISNAGTLRYSSSTDQTLSGQITGSGNLIKDSAASILTLTGANAFTGGILVSQGQVRFSNGQFVGGTITLNDASTGSANTAFLSTGAQTNNNNIVVTADGTGTVSLGAVPGAGGLHLYNGNLTLNRAVTLNGTSDRATFVGKISGNVGLLTIDGGTSGHRTTIGNPTNDFVGNVLVKPGSVLQDDALGGAIPDASNMTVYGWFKLNTASTNETIGGLSGSGIVQNHESVGGTPTLTMGSGNQSGSFSGSVLNGSGTFSITKIGTGTQYLTGTNTWVGPTTVTAGTLVVSAATHASAYTVADGATLGVAGSAGSMFSPNSLTLGATTGVTLNVTNFSSSATNAPVTVVPINALTTNGTVTVNVSGSNFQTGTFPLVRYSGAVGGAGAAAFALGTLPSGVTATLVNNPANYTIDLNITAVAGALVWDGDTSAWDVNTSDNWTPGGSPSKFQNGDAVLFNDTASGTTAVTLNAAVLTSGVTFNNTSATYSVSGSGGFSGASGLTKTGTGSATVATANSYTGPTTVSAGTLIAGSSTALGTPGASAFTFGAGSDAKLQLNGNSVSLARLNSDPAAVNSIIESGAGTAGTDVLTLTSNLDSTFTGVLQNGGTRTLGLIKAGSGILTLSGSSPNTNTGGATVAVGRLQLSKAANVAAVSGPVTMVNAEGNYLYPTQDNQFGAGTVLTLSGGSGNSRFELLGTTQTLAGIVNDGSGLGVIQHREQVPVFEVSSISSLILDGSGNYSYNGYLRDSGGGILRLTKNGSGTQTFGNGNVSYTGGTIINGGVLNLNYGGGSGCIRGTVTVNTGAILRLSAGDATGYTVGATNLSTINLAGGTMDVANIAGNQTLGSATINMTGGAITGLGLTSNNIDFFGGASTLNTLASPNPSTISGVTLSPLRQGSTTFTVADGTAAIDLDISAVIRTSPSGDNGSSTLFKAGPGTMRLTAVNTNVRPFQINAGTVILNGSATFATVTVASGATLTGTGTASGAVTVQAGGFIAPGNSVGSFNTGAATLAGTYNCEIDGASADIVNVTGNLNITGATLAFTTLNTPTATSYVIATYTGTLTGSAPTVTGMPAGYAIDLSTPGQIKLVQGYGAWASLKGLTGANNGLNQDPDNDGVSNLMEFYLDGNPLASDLSILPASTLDATYLTLTFKRRDDAELDVASQAVQFGGTLASWTSSVIGPVTTPADGNGVIVTVAENGTSPDDVTIQIPRTHAVGGKLFARLDIVK